MAGNGETFVLDVQRAGQHNGPSQQQSSQVGYADRSSGRAGLAG